MHSPFVGPAYAARSLNLAAQQCVNLYLEVVETKTGKVPAALIGAPGLTLAGTVGTGPVRGMRVVAGALYVVSGNALWSGLSGPVQLGAIGTSGGPVTMIDNGTQAAVFDGQAGYLVAKGAVSPLPLAFGGAPVLSGAYQDGFGLAAQAGTNQWYQSNLFDLSAWQPLNFSSASAQPDNVLAMADLHREVWLLKEAHGEVWVNAGNSGFAFSPITGVHIEHGIAAPASLAFAGDSLAWLSKDMQGQGVAVLSKGYQASRISTHALEATWGGYVTIADAQGYSYQQDGHVFYVLTFPTANATWVYDLTASAQLGFPCWHQRAGFSNGLFTRHRSNCFCAYNGQLLVGDYANGNIYTLDLTNNTDNGAQRKWLRSWRATQQLGESPARFSSLRIDMETGMGVPSGASPQCMLRWSDDGGHTWAPQILAAAGPTGATAKRVMYRRLGSTRRTSGLDRVFELSSSDPFKVALLGAELIA